MRAVCSNGTVLPVDPNFPAICDFVHCIDLNGWTIMQWILSEREAMDVWLIMCDGTLTLLNIPCYVEAAGTPEGTLSANSSSDSSSASYTARVEKHKPRTWMPTVKHPLVQIDEELQSMRADEVG